MKCPRHGWLPWKKIGPSNQGRIAWTRKCGFCPETQWRRKRPKNG